MDMWKYKVYRAFTDDNNSPPEDSLKLLAEITHPTATYTDTTVFMNQQENYKVWYAVKAKDDSSHHSLFSKVIRFWAYYNGESEGGYVSITAVNVKGDFSISASPNPFNPVTTLNFTLPEDAQVDLMVYNLSGRLVTTLIDGWCEAGTYNVHFEGYNLPSGVYIYHLEAGGYSGSGKMVLVK